MITHLNIGNGGRLGNAMFQYAAAKSLAIITNSELKLPHDIFNRIHDGQQCLLNHFNIDFKPINENDKIENLYMEKIGKKFDPEFLIQKPNTNLMGHFETERYFENIEEIIKHDFTHKDNLIEYANNYLISIKTKYTKDIQIIGIHFRRGDYLNNPKTRNFHGYCTISYFENAINLALNRFSTIDTILANCLLKVTLTVLAIIKLNCLTFVAIKEVILASVIFIIFNIDLITFTTFDIVDDLITLICLITLTILAFVIDGVVDGDASAVLNQH